MKEDLSALAGFMMLVGIIRYGWTVWRDRKKSDGSTPTKSSWLIWVSVDCITFAGMWARHALNGQITATIVGGLVVLVLVLIFGRPGWDKLDKIVLAAAAVGLVLWWALDSPELGILTSGALVVIGTIPTAGSVIVNPSREDKAAWTFYFVSCVFALIAIPRWDTLADTVQPISFTIVNTSMVLILYAPRRTRIIVGYALRCGSRKVRNAFRRT